MGMTVKINISLVGKINMSKNIGEVFFYDFCFQQNENIILMSFLQKCIDYLGPHDDDNAWLTCGELKNPHAFLCMVLVTKNRFSRMSIAKVWVECLKTKKVKESLSGIFNISCFFENLVIN